VKGMDVIKKCCYRSLRENRKRTAVTIVGIILATALITGVACMVESFRASMIAYEKQNNGDYHYWFSQVAGENLKYFRNNRNIVKFGLSEEVGYTFLEGSQNPDKPYLYIRAVDEEGIRAMSLKLIEGRMPENDSELLISRHIATNGLVDYKIGDVLTCRIGLRMSEGYQLAPDNCYLGEEEELIFSDEKTYTVVGVIERPNTTMENRMAPGYSVFTCLSGIDEGESGKVYDESLAGHKFDVYASFTDWGLRHAAQVTEGILGRQPEAVAESVTEHYWLVRWELFIFSSNTMAMLYAMSAIAVMIIIVTSVFCIRNSFVISMTEKMKLYGRLASVGTTARQQRKMVYDEAVLLGGIGIPLGVACGVGATAILVKAVGGLVEDAIDLVLVFAVSVPAILIGAVLSAVTVFFSASKSARQAAKISPISAIRAADTVRINKREMKCPQAIGRLFGIGGKVAFKNLKRARVKYRTTVISIVVSVAAFIGLSSFTRLMNLAADIYYEDLQYQLVVSVWDNEDSYAQALQVAGTEGIQETEICRMLDITVEAAQVPYTRDYLEIHEINSGRGENVRICSLGEEGYARYCRRLGVSVEEAEDKAIVLASYETESRKDGKVYVNAGKIAEYRPGDILTGTCKASGEDGADREVSIEVLVQTEEKPMFMSNFNSNSIVLIVSDAWMDHWRITGNGDISYVHIKCEDAGRVEEIIREDLALSHYTLTNYDALYRSERSTQLVVSIFLYGFITVVSLIGITNIFNTITTNMELRAPEFAMLKSVGMTGREFRRMIWLEGLFYGGKALIIGIPIGVAVSYCFNLALGEGIVTAFQFPWDGILLSTAAVIVLLYVIMHYSLAKINRKNIIETIRNENI